MPKIPRRDSDQRSHHAKPSTTIQAKRLEPVLPGIEDADAWHPATVEWWRNSVCWLAQSDAGRELVDADHPGLIRLAMLVDAFFTAETIKERLSLAAEIRLSSGAYGLDPASRRRLGWRVETPEAETVMSKYTRKSGMGAVT